MTRAEVGKKYVAHSIIGFHAFMTIPQWLAYLFVHELKTRSN